MGNGSGEVADLEIALASVRDRIAKFRGQAIGEENTKHALIEPVLKALGWNVEDLDEVRCEYKFKQADNPVDYALFANGNLRLFVEAKAMGENLDEPAVQSQITGYAGVAGVAGSGRLAPEEGQDRDYDQFGDRPADKGNNGGDIENRARGVQGIRPQDAFKRCDEDLAEVEDAGHKAVGSSGIQEEQHDAPYDQELDQAENEADDPLPYFDPAGARCRSLASVDCHSFHRALEASGEAGQPGPPPGDAPATVYL